MLLGRSCDSLVDKTCRANVDLRAFQGVAFTNREDRQADYRFLVNRFRVSDAFQSVCFGGVSVLGFSGVSSNNDFKESVASARSKYAAARAAIHGRDAFFSGVAKFGVENEVRRFLRA